MLETFGAGQSVELAVVERSGFVESRHLGAVSVVDPAGNEIVALGNTVALIYPRSTLKPFQAAAVLSSGVELTGDLAAIATSSHTGTDLHVRLVREILSRAYLTPGALQCPADWPLDRRSRDELVLAREEKAPVYMCCSGKHAAMLYACVVNEWPVASYLETEHPLQVRVKEVMERFIGEKIQHTGVDGCGAPVHAMTLTALARGIRSVVTGSPSSPFGMFRAGAVITQAVREHGEIVAGPGEPDTAVIDRLGLFAKTGAEGITVVSAADGTTVAVKVLDGSSRAGMITALHALKNVGALTQAHIDDVTPSLHLTVYGGGAPVGTIRSSI